MGSKALDNSMRIVKARITEMPKAFGDPMPRVMVCGADEEEHFLFDYYPDEISFTADEFVGLTVDEARQRKFKKDKHYLQS